MHVGTSAFDLKEHDTDLVTISSHITDVSVTTHVNFPKALGVCVSILHKIRPCHSSGHK